MVTANHHAGKCSYDVNSGWTNVGAFRLRITSSTIIAYKQMRIKLTAYSH
ncbi:hypothetical protein BN128_1570 [Cronobacter sakazakii 696]|nr:hypothetical protein BN128_1570 [Cronobacter sakazakii 696]